MKEYGKQILVSIIAAVFVFGVGYALLSDTITVTGSASATGSLDIDVKSSTFASSTGAGNATINTITEDEEDVLRITVPALEYPGASVTFTIVLENKGSLSGKLTAINTGGAAASNPTDLQVTSSGIAVNDIIAPNEEKTITITATWLSSSTAAFTATQFNIDFVFQQSI